MIKRPTTHSALRFVLLIGTVSFFADFTYEGARSIAGPYLAYLGAGALVVSVIAGFGELLGYGLRLLSGRLADNPRNLWPVTLFGYAMQMAAVPALALAGSWQTAAALMIAERVGKATRNPPRDVMLSTPAPRSAVMAGPSASTRPSTRPERWRGRRSSPSSSPCTRATTASPSRRWRCPPC